jgi:hypothetical protein
MQRPPDENSRAAAISHVNCVTADVIYLTAAGLGGHLQVRMADPKDKPTEQDVLNKPEEEKNLDHDGGEKQPTDQSESK